MSDNFYQKLNLEYPFLSVCTYGDIEYVGIIQNRDSFVTFFYDYGSITDLEMKRRFLELGDKWWWDSNRMVPIDIFLKSEWVEFKPYLKIFTTKNMKVLHGPTTTLSELAKTRTKRRSITLVKRL